MPNKYSNEDIELRSEKVRSIIGQIPPRLLRVGISIISVVVLSILITVYFIPYPEYQVTSVKLYTNPNFQIEKAYRSGTITVDVSKTLAEFNEQIGVLEIGNDSILYIAKSKGKILYNCSNDDYLEEGDIIFSIIPNEIDSVYGICYLSHIEMKQISHGDSIDIILNEKSLGGVISYIYPINEVYNNEILYKAKITFLKDFNTIDLINNRELDGKILISQKPILRRILNLN